MKRIQKCIIWVCSLLFLLPFALFAQRKVNIPTDKILVEVESNGKWGFIDPTGKWIIEPGFEGAKKFVDGVALVKYLGEWHYMNGEAEMISEGKPYTVRYNFSEGLGRVEENALWGYINQTGEWAIQPVYDDARDFSEGYAAVKTGTYWGYIDKYGNRIIEPSFLIAKDFHDGVALVKTTKGFRYLSITNTFLPVPDDIELKHDFSDGMAPVVKSKLWGFVNTEGEVIIPPQYSKMRKFTEGLAPVRQNKTWGYIDKTGNWVIEPRFQDAKNFSDGIGLVKKAGQWCYINTNGELLGEGELYIIHHPFHEGLARTELRGNWGFIDINGNWIIQPEFERARDFSNGYAAVRQNGRWGFTDRNGNMVIPPHFDNAKDFIRIIYR
ncbi:MAG: WG repeat-containing protein [Bacteroidales bacterium]|nr:MAG: WG repeat-containing protein [Bacteroidales bacterium]